VRRFFLACLLLPVRPPFRPLLLLGLIGLIGACGRLDQVGKSPGFTPLDGTNQHHAMYSAPLPEDQPGDDVTEASSLWASGRESLFGDRRAVMRGDILTVVIEIDDSAEISNSTGRSRQGRETMGVPSLFGLPERLDETNLAEAVEATGASNYKGTGSVSRAERLTLRVAATVIEELPNGVLRIEGSQEVRVNNELRELVVTGYVRPIDISRQNEITYDKIAGARVSYGGRGLISDVQAPRYGQQVADVLLPF
jgi:flagellar L-ring protein FlgH